MRCPAAERAPSSAQPVSARPLLGRSPTAPTRAPPPAPAHPLLLGRTPACSSSLGERHVGAPSSSSSSAIARLERRQRVHGRLVVGLGALHVAGMLLGAAGAAGRGAQLAHGAGAQLLAAEERAEHARCPPRSPCSSLACEAALSLASIACAVATHLLLRRFARAARTSSARASELRIERLAGRVLQPHPERALRFPHVRHELERLALEECRRGACVVMCFCSERAQVA